MSQRRIQTEKLRCARGMVARAVINASRMNGRHAAMEGKTLRTTTRVCVALPMLFAQEPDLHGRISRQEGREGNFEWGPTTIYLMRSTRPNS